MPSNLPPGVTHRHIEEQAGGDEGCAVCFLPSDVCICPECPVCKAHGDPICYHEVDGHGLKLDQKQLMYRSEMKIKQLQDDISDERMYQLWLKDHPEANSFIEEV